MYVMAQEDNPISHGLASATWDDPSSGQQAGGLEHRPKHAANDVCATSVVVCFAVSVPNRVVLFLLPNHRHEE
jgi:hypothetical protein